MNDENIAHRHRHGKAWEQQREKRIDEDYRNLRKVILVLVGVWLLVIGVCYWWARAKGIA